jgi:hypothetical protein
VALDRPNLGLLEARVGGVAVSHLSGVSVASQASSDVVTDTSTVGGATVEASLDLLDAQKADLAGPVFTGNARAVTPAANDNDTSIATTAFVQTELADYAPLASPTLTGVPAAPTAAAATSTTQIATTAFATTADNLKANLASPTLTGVPLAPTAAPGTNTTQIATTAFVTALGALKADAAFTPGDPTAFVDPDPTTLQEVIDRLIDVVVTLNAGPIG